jgi:hypothetical protein
MSCIITNEHFSHKNREEEPVLRWNLWDVETKDPKVIKKRYTKQIVQPKEKLNVKPLEGPNVKPKERPNANVTSRKREFIQRKQLNVRKFQKSQQVAVAIYERECKA